MSGDVGAYGWKWGWLANVWVNEWNGAHLSISFSLFRACRHSAPLLFFSFIRRHDFTDSQHPFHFPVLFARPNSPASARNFLIKRARVPPFAGWFQKVVKRARVYPGPFCLFRVGQATFVVPPIRECIGGGCFPM